MEGDIYGQIAAQTYGKSADRIQEERQHQLAQYASMVNAAMANQNANTRDTHLSYANAVLNPMLFGRNSSNLPVSSQGVQPADYHPVAAMQQDQNDRWLGYATAGPLKMTSPTPDQAKYKEWQDAINKAKDLKARAYYNPALWNNVVDEENRAAKARQNAFSEYYYNNGVNDYGLPISAQTTPFWQGITNFFKSIYPF